MLHLTGRALDNIIGVHISTLFSPNALNNKPLRFDLLQRGEIVFSEREIVHPDGKLIPIEMHTKMMPDGTYQSILHDITKRKHAEEVLQESERKFRDLAEKSVAGVYLVQDGILKYANLKLAQVSGFNR